METNDNQAIIYWAEDDRPREKFLLKGKSALSNAELIAILIGSGNSEKSAVQLAQEILDMAGNNLIELSRMTVKELMQFRGMGPAKAVSVVAALELGKRRLAEKALEKPEISASSSAYNLLLPDLADSYYEQFFVLLLDNKNRLIKKVLVSSGGTARVVVDAKRIFKEAILYNASAIILAHNHPANDTKPSTEDELITKKMIKAGKVLNIRIHDHLIIGNDNYFSFADEGMM